jgi:hypothetical protein
MSLRQTVRDNLISVLLAGLSLAVLLALTSALSVWGASALRPAGESLVVEANLCLTLPQGRVPHVGVGWIARGAAPAGLSRRPLTTRIRLHPGAVCGTVPWTPVLPKRGTLVFPPT